MHLDEMVEDRFVGFDQEARHEGIPLRGRKALQVLRIVVSPQLREPGDDVGRHTPQRHRPNAQGAKQLVPIEIGQDRWRCRLRGIGLEVKQRRPVGSLRDREQAIEGLTQLGAELGGNALEEALLGAGGNRDHEPLHGRLRRRNHLPGPQEVLGMGEQLLPGRTVLGPAGQLVF